MNLYKKINVCPRCKRGLVKGTIFLEQKAAITNLANLLNEKLQYETIIGTIRYNELREMTSEQIVRFLSKYKLASYSTLKNILNSGREFKSANEIFESLDKTHETIEKLWDFFMH